MRNLLIPLLFLILSLNLSAESSPLTLSEAQMKNLVPATWNPGWKAKDTDFTDGEADITLEKGVPTDPDRYHMGSIKIYDNINRPDASPDSKDTKALRDSMGAVEIKYTGPDGKQYRAFTNKKNTMSIFTGRFSIDIFMAIGSLEDCVSNIKLLKVFNAQTLKADRPPRADEIISKPADIKLDKKDLETSKRIIAALEKQGIKPSMTGKNSYNNGVVVEEGVPFLSKEEFSKLVPTTWNPGWTGAWKANAQEIEIGLSMGSMNDLANYKTHRLMLWDDCTPGEAIKAIKNIQKQIPEYKDATFTGPDKKEYPAICYKDKDATGMYVAVNRFMFELATENSSFEEAAANARLLKIYSVIEKPKDTPKKTKQQKKKVSKK